MLDDKNLITKDELSQSLKNEIYGNGDYYIPDITVEGRTLTNLLGRAGNAIYKQDWNVVDSVMSYTSDTFTFSNNGSISKDINTKIGSSYLICFNRNNMFEKRIFVASDTTTNISISISDGDIISYIRVYEIDSNEQLNNCTDEKYPYVDDCKSIVNPYFECNENLIFENDYYTCGFINTDGQVGVDESSTLLTHMDYSIKTEKDEVYTISVEGDIPSGYKLVLWNMRDNANNDYEKCISDTNVATVTCLDKGVIKYGINCVDSTLDERKELINKINTKEIRFTLVKGDKPKTYEECHNSRIMFETTLFEGEKITRQNDGSYVKNSEWDEYNINNIENSLGFVVAPSNDYHAVGFKIKDLYDDNSLSKLVSYNGSIIKNEINGNFNFEHFYFDLKNTENRHFVIVLPNTLTGWGDDYTPTQEEIRAFFLGWKLLSGTTGGLYNDPTSTQEKQWFKLWCGMGECTNIHNVVDYSNTSVCPTALNNQGYTPYRLIYKKETPIIEEVKTYGELAIKDGVDVVSGSGLVLGESYTNHLCTYDETGSETLINCTHRFLKTKPYKILNIINDKGEIELFQDRLHNFVYSHIEVYINHGYSQAIIKYNNDIKNYFVDYIMWETVQSYNYTISDKLSLKDTLNKTTESISDVYEELAKTKKELEHTRYELSQRSNPNLLINGDFQVWQRGDKFTDSLKTYTADRWCASIGISSVSSVYKSEKGLIIDVPSSSNKDMVLRNSLENLPCGKYTLSAKINGKVYVTLCIVTSYPSFSNNFTFLDGQVSLKLSKNSVMSGFPFVEIYVKKGCKIEIEWVKLEKGEYATPFIPKSYSEELKDCQRYYEEIVTNSMINKTDILVYHNFITQKRNSYTISIYDGFSKDKTNKNEINVVNNGTAILTNPVIYSDKDNIRFIRTAQNIYLKSNPEKIFTSGFALLYLIIDAEIY